MGTAGIVGTVEPHHYLWWFPGSPVKVHLSFGVVRQIRNRLLDVRPDYSEEGLLFGEIRDGITEILDFAPATREDVASSVAGLPPGRSRSLVGYYRTGNSEALQLNARDHELARECFPKPFAVFLIVHRNRLGPPTATFFFHDRECRMAEFAFLEFPFDPSLLAAEQYGRMQRSQQANEQPAVVIPPAPGIPALALAAPTPAAIHHPKRLAWKAPLWIALLMSAAGAGVLLNDGSVREQYLNLKQAISAWLIVSRPPSPGAPKSASHPSMSLHAVRQNADLALTWNRESALIANATSGALSIKDGESTRVVPFDPARLRDGSILYSPKTDQILMQLTVSTATDSYTESVTVILPTGKEARTEPALPPRTFIPAATPPSPLPDTVVKLMKPFIAPALPERALQSLPSLQDPPSVNDRPTSPMALPSALTLIPGSVERPTATPSPAHTPPSSAPAMTSSYEPAIPIVKIQPRVPPELRPLLFKKLTVEVRVSIGKTGKVLHAEAVPLKNVNQMLLNSAVDASLSWKFRPAMLNHEAVASESILQFVFNP